MDFDGFLDLLRALAREDVDYVLVGGVALGLHGLLRATEDVDLFVRPEPGNVERLKRALRAVWNDPDIAQISAGDLAGDYPTVRYGPPGEAFVIDVLARLGSAFAFEDLELQTMSIEGVPVCVATPSTLYRMKKDTGRPIVPVRRFRDLDEARRALWTGPEDPALPMRIRRLWAFSRRLTRPLAHPRGERRFRTIEAANADRELRAAERVRALRAERGDAGRAERGDAGSSPRG